MKFAPASKPLSSEGVIGKYEQGSKVMAPEFLIGGFRNGNLVGRLRDLFGSCKCYFHNKHSAFI